MNDMTDYRDNTRLPAEDAPEENVAEETALPADAVPTENAEGQDTADTDDLTADFEALIRGRYKTAFDQRVRKILDGRLKNLRRENEELRAGADAGLDAAAMALGRLERDAGAIRAVYPDFSWQAELENPAFARLIGAGVDGRTAYEVVHRDELLRRAMAYAARRAAAQTARSIASGARPAAENGGRSVAVTRSDPRKLTSEELADIRKRVQNGEKIRF